MRAIISVIVALGVTLPASAQERRADYFGGKPTEATVLSRNVFQVVTTSENRTAAVRWSKGDNGLVQKMIYTERGHSLDISEVFNKQCQTRLLRNLDLVLPPLNGFAARHYPLDDQGALITGACGVSPGDEAISAIRIVISNAGEAAEGRGLVVE